MISINLAQFDLASFLLGALCGTLTLTTFLWWLGWRRGKGAGDW